MLTHLDAAAQKKASQTTGDGVNRHYCANYYSTVTTIHDN